ncbi:acetolactate synthase catalytic subunit, partial [Exiguobacterium mexicanum]
ACTKHSFLVEAIEDLPRILAEAFAIANSGRPGPVLIDIPKDIQLQHAELSPFLMPVEQETTSPLSEIQQARALLQQSEKPMLYIGGGVGMSGAVSELRKFIEFTGIPSVATLKGLG